MSQTLQDCGSYEFLTPHAHIPEQLLIIERAARTCYQSFDEEKHGTMESASKMVRMLINFEHYSMLGFGHLAVRFKSCSRGFTHEVVRHGPARYAQESTRYVKYGKDGHEARAVAPDGITPEQFDAFDVAFQAAFDAYGKLRETGMRPEWARQVLPTGLVSEICMAANFQEWRHVFHMRCDRPAHPEIRSIMCDLLVDLKGLIPVMFDDFILAGEHNGAPYYMKSDSNGHLHRQLLLLKRTNPERLKALLEVLEETNEKEQP